uniref:Uncharacterized protein n=1 Tax=Rhizophora mucronata TaxID=61149 RepID=A0A2P2QHD8_RHIMU
MFSTSPTKIKVRLSTSYSWELP